MKSKFLDIIKLVIKALLLGAIAFACFLFYKNGQIQQQQIENANTTIKALQDELAQIKTDNQQHNNDLKKTIEEQQNRLVEIADKNAETQTKISDMRNSIEELGSKIPQIKADALRMVKTLAATKSTLQSDVEALKKSVKDWQQDYVSVLSEHDKFFDNIDKEINSMNKALDEKFASVDSLLDQLNSRVNALSSQENKPTITRFHMDHDGISLLNKNKPAETVTTK